jgi:hypothetical protein
LIHGNTDIGGTTVLPLPEQIEGANTPQGNAASESTVSSHKPIYTIDELVVLHGFSRRTVIRLYEREPGVQVLERPEALFGSTIRSEHESERLKTGVMERAECPRCRTLVLPSCPDSHLADR